MIRCKQPGSVRPRFTLSMNRQVVGYPGAREFSEVLPWNSATCRKLLMASRGWREGDPATEILKFEFKGSGWREVESAPEILKLEFKGSGWREVEPVPEILKLEFKGAVGEKSNRFLETRAQPSGRL
ncbi:hypothetical protein TIFTF001_035671 [Ficus carica]|uniref:Uncharacterized protein n=1 Tax=Ficus carica TaxID=3494 RepID=A0AA88JAE2_FICCA|nr:hypothetical protein TIFTF001_035671 [Ficus carica]